MEHSIPSLVQTDPMSPATPKSSLAIVAPTTLDGICLDVFRDDLYYFEDAVFLVSIRLMRKEEATH